MNTNTIEAITNYVNDTVQLKDLSGSEFEEVRSCLLQIKAALTSKDGPSMDIFDAELKTLKGLKTAAYDFARRIEELVTAG